MSSTITPEAVRHALARVSDPDLRKDLVSLGFVKDLAIDGGRVAFTIELATPLSKAKAGIGEQARAAVAAIDGIESVEVTLASRIRSATAPERGGPPLAGVKNVIAVGAGKGGVGKT